MTRYATLRAAICLIALMAFAAGRSAQAQFGTAGAGGFVYPADVTAAFEPPVGFTGETVRLDVTVAVHDGHYLYGMDPTVDPEAFGPFGTRVEFDLPAFLEPVEGEEWTEQDPKIKFDKGFETDVRYHTGRVLFSRVFRVAGGTTAGAYPVSGQIRKQICDDSSCLPPRASPFSATLTVRTRGESPNATPVVAETPEPTPTPAPEVEPADEVTTSPMIAKVSAAVYHNESDSDRLAKESLGRLAWVAFLAGLLSLLTPCVFPMIPITISFFTKRASKTAAERIGLCSVYAGSIVVGFALIGFGLAVVMKVFGVDSSGAGAINRFAANPWLNLGITAVFVVFALSLFGAFDIGLPAGWANRLQQKRGGRTDVVGAFFMAIVFVIVSFTCTAPIVGPLVVLTFQGSWITPFVGLTCYALGFALPFFFLGLVPGAVAGLPKSGSWLNATKVTMGLVEMAAAFKFLSNADLVWQWNVFTREVVLAAWGAIAVIACLYLLGVVAMEKDGAAKTAIGSVRMVFGMAFGTLALYLAFGLFAGRLHPGVESFLPPTTTNPVQTVSAGGSTAHEDVIRNDLELARAKSRETGKPLFIDFTGWTCTNCRLNEFKVFPKPDVKALLDEYVVVQLYTDDLGTDAEGHVIGEKYQRYQSDRFGTFSLPFYATLTPEGETVATYGGLIRDTEEFKNFLRQAIGV